MLLADLQDDKRRQYQVLITSAFLTDLEKIHEGIGCRPIVVLFDTFNNASRLVKKWMADVLIEEIRRKPWFVCVVAGQQTPCIPEETRNWCRLESLTDSQIELLGLQLIKSAVSTRGDPRTKRIVTGFTENPAPREGDEAAYLLYQLFKRAVERANRNPLRLKQVMGALLNDLLGN